MGMFDRLKNVGGSDAARKPHRFGVAGEDAAPSDNLSKAMNESGGITPGSQTGTTAGTGLVASIRRAVRGVASGAPEDSSAWAQQSKLIAEKRAQVKGARYLTARMKRDKSA